VRVARGVYTTFLLILVFLGREFPTSPQGVNTPNFCTTPPASYLDNPLISHRGVLNIIITFAKYKHEIPLFDFQENH